MLKKLLFGLVGLALILGATTKPAFAGPPWPAEVFQVREGEFCSFPWFNDIYQLVTLTGTGMWEAQYINGQAQWNCHTVLDFSSPNIASTAEVCAVLEGMGFDLCNGNGSFRWEQTYEPLPHSCSVVDEQGNVFWSEASHLLVTPNGHVNISCHFDINP